MTATPQQPQHMTSADDILAGLDPDQRAVATELDGPMRVLAGAGTGKTRAITHRIAYGIAIGRYQGPRVLALTFTLRAAEEMRTRLHQLGAHGVQARTFHSAALRQLAYFWPQVVGGTFPSIVQNKAALITEAANRLRISTDRSLLRDLASLIEWAKVQLLTPDTIMQRLSEKQLPSAVTPQNMQRIFQAYEDLKDERNLIDFEDVLLLTIAMLEEDEKLAATSTAILWWTSTRTCPRCSSVCWMRGWAAATIFAWWAMPPRRFTLLPARPAVTCWILRAGTVARTR